MKVCRQVTTGKVVYHRLTTPPQAGTFLCARRSADVAPRIALGRRRARKGCIITHALAKEAPVTEGLTPATITEAPWTAADVIEMFRSRADLIEARLPLTNRELELLRCLTHKRRPDGRLLRVRKIAKLFGCSADEIHDTLAALERKGLIARPSMEVGTFRLQVLAGKGGAV